MKKILYVFVFLISGVVYGREGDDRTYTGGQISRLTNADLNFQLPRFIFSNTNTRIVVKFNNPDNYKLGVNKRTLHFIVNGSEQEVTFDDKGMGSFYYTFKNNNELTILYEDVNYSIQPDIISIWYIITPLALMLLFFVYRIILPIRKNKGPNMVIKHHTDTIIDNTTDFTSTLKVIRVKEPVEEF